MAPQFDFAVYGPDAQVTSVIEVRARRSTTSSWAAQLRRNMLAHSQVPLTAMFVIATPKALYLWEPTARRDELPTYEVDANKIFGPYFERIGGENGESATDPIVFEMIVKSWLEDVADASAPVEPALEESGFTDRLRSGRVIAELAA